MLRKDINPKGRAKHGASRIALIALLPLFFVLPTITHAYSTITVLDSFTQNNSFFTYKYRVTNTTLPAGIPQFSVIKTVFRHIESLTPPTFPTTGTAEGQNPPGWIPSWILVQDNAEVDVYQVTFTSVNENNFGILGGFQEQFYFTVRGPLGEVPVMQALPTSLSTATFHSFSGTLVHHIVPVLDFDDTPPPLTPPILDNMTVSGGQICFDISNMTVGALITIECNANITNPTGWAQIDSFTPTTTTSNRCEPLGSSSVYRAKAQ